MIIVRRFNKDSDYIRFTGTLNCPNHRIMHKKDGTFLYTSTRRPMLFSTVSNFLTNNVVEIPFDIMYKLDNGLSLGN